MRWTKKAVPVALSVVMAGSSILYQNNLTAFAAQDSSRKEEVVYANLDENGNVTGIYVVNSFQGGKITDYGTYSTIRNLTTTDKIHTEGDKITVTTDAEKLFYQGDLDTKEIPWNISIKYLLDGKEYKAEQLAGKSGKLEIKISITQNPNCNETFWKGYALQASLSLDGNKCSNIVSEGATIANVGSDKQLSYIIMPGKGKEISISADVKDFEMQGISINGTKLNLNLEIDESELTEKVKELQDGVKEFSDGVSELSDGTQTLADGAYSLYDGSASLEDGAGTLDAGMTSLNSGMDALQTAFNTLNNQSGNLTQGSAQMLSALQTLQASLNQVSVNVNDLDALVTASLKIQEGIGDLTEGLQEMNQNVNGYYQQMAGAGITGIDDYTQKHTEAIRLLEVLLADEAYAGYRQQLETLLQGDIAYIQGSNALIQGIGEVLDSENGMLMQGALTLQKNYAEFHRNIQMMVNSLEALTGNMVNLKNGVESLVENYEALDTGVDAYTDAVAQIVVGYQAIYDGVRNAAQGASQLYGGTQELTEGALGLYTGTEQLENGVEKLSDGIGEFSEKTADMDGEISDTIDDKIDEITGKNEETVSFVSEQNTNIESVLFVIKTPAIEIPEKEEAVTQTEGKQTFWQKFLKLFGLG